MTVRREHDVFRPETHMRERRRRSRPAVINERQRPLVRIGDIFLDVRHVEERSLWRSRIILDHIVPRGSRVADLLATDHRLMMRNRRFLIRRRQSRRGCRRSCRTCRSGRRCLLRIRSASSSAPLRRRDTGDQHQTRAKRRNSIPHHPQMLSFVVFQQETTETSYQLQVDSPLSPSRQ